MDKYVTDTASFFDLVNYLNDDNSTTDFDLNFAGSLTKLSIEIKGENYTGSLTANSMEGLIGLQKSIYRSYAIVAFGQQNYKKLTQTQKDKLTIIFAVSEGSTVVDGALESVINAFKEVCQDMDNKTKAIVLCVIFAMLCTTYGAVTISETYISSQVQIDENQTRLELEKERTKQMELMLKKSSHATDIKETIQQGITELLQGVNDAESVSIAQGMISKEVIKAVNDRAARRKATEGTVRSKYLITRIEIPNGSDQKFEIRDVHTEESFVVALDDELSAQDKTKIWEHAKNNTALDLQLSVTKIGDTVKSGTVTGVIINRTANTLSV